MEKYLKKIFDFLFFQCSKKATFYKDHVVSVAPFPLNYSNE